MQGSSLWTRLCSLEVLRQAWQRVADNMGCGGIDKVSIKDFEFNHRENINILRNLLLSGEYKPLSVLKVNIEKPVGGKRVLGIPAIRDRIVQQAVVNVLQTVFEKEFLGCSYAYRPGSSAHKALNKLEKYLKKGKHWIVDADIESFFDSVNHTLLMSLIKDKVDEAPLIGLIERILKSGCEDDRGILQGAVTSPLFSNIYLHEFDKKLTDAGFNLIRYADDFVILTESKEAAEQALELARDNLSELLLRLNENKTRICNLREGFVFLGYEFTEKGKGPSRKAIHSLLGKIYQEATRSSNREGAESSERLRSIIKGWQGYFKLNAQSRSELIEELNRLIENESSAVGARIALAASYIDSDDFEKAKEIIANRFSFPSDQPEIHYQWGILCDELNMTDDARDEFFNVLKLNPNHKEATYYLGLMYLRKGMPEKSIRYLQKAIQIDPNFASAYYALGKAYERWGLHGIARKSFRQAVQLDPNLAGVTSTEWLKRPKDKATSLSFSDADIDLFLKLFQGREGLYAKQWVSDNGKMGYFPVKEPLTHEVVKAHLKGDLTAGLYLVRADDTVRNMVIDVDIAKKAMARWSQNEEARTALDEEIKRYIKAIVSVCEELKISVYIEDSGYKGRHCWFFFIEPIKACVARELGKCILKRASESPVGLNRELFPKQDKVSPDGLGCLIKLPLGIHKETGRQCLFVDPNGRPFQNQFKYLRKVKFITGENVREAILSLKDDTKQVRELKGDSERIRRVIEGCNVIRYLVNKAKEERHLAHTERLVLLYSLGHLNDQGKKYIHYIMGHCLNYDFNCTQRWINRLQTNIRPISCPKIRDWLCDITPSIGCYCEFKVPQDGYPSPILHVNPSATAKLSKDKRVSVVEPPAPAVGHLEGETVKELVTPRGEEDYVDEILKEYIDLKRSRRKMDEKIKEYEGKLNAVFDDRNVQALVTSFGILRREQKQGTITLIIEI